ncbi:unnamed protein product [Toxocara canis]|uniref:non-specific serine/threonine protein kinase n=1 Tax=Toxocara canis TaxID=6265 RepID=A0A3P7GLN3_TOXCA|nr:unnamed protein product [Toxocara canis]
MTVDPERCLTADELMSDVWIVRCSSALDTPLCTADLLNDEKNFDLLDAMRGQLTGIRAINKQIEIKPLDEATNAILQRRCKIKKADAGSTSITPSSTIPPSPTPCIPSD